MTSMEKEKQGTSDNKKETTTERKLAEKRYVDIKNWRLKFSSGILPSWEALQTSYIL